MPVWINEFHYDNVGTDLGERIEIVATVGTDVSGYSIVRYNGNTPGAAVPYTTPAATNSVNLSAITPTTVGGFSYYVIIFPSNGLQNGPNDGFALVNGSTVVQLLSYAGVFTAAAGAPGGVAAGQTSTDVGQTQSNTTTPVGDSLQLTGTGDEYSDFTWSPTGASTFGGPNTGQTLVGGGGGETQTVVFNPISVTHDEGNSGTTAYSFIVTRTGGTTGQLDFSGTIAAGGTNNADYVGGTAPTVFSGSILAGQTSATVTVNVQGDYTIEPTRAFTLTLTRSSNTDGSVTASIGTDLTRDRQYHQRRFHRHDKRRRRQPCRGQCRHHRRLLHRHPHRRRERHGQRRLCDHPAGRSRRRRRLRRQRAADRHRHLPRGRDHAPRSRSPSTATSPTSPTRPSPSRFPMRRAEPRSATATPSPRSPTTMPRRSFRSAMQAVSKAITESSIWSSPSPSPSLRSTRSPSISRRPTAPPSRTATISASPARSASLRATRARRSASPSSATTCSRPTRR